MVDFDGDGDQDILSGSWPGEVYVFRGSGKRGGIESYSKGEKLKSSWLQTVNVGRASAAFAGDWEGDGDLDLVVGNIEGEVVLVPNQGTTSEPEYGKSRRLTAGGKKAIRVRGGDAGPVLADWDRDGRIDLLVGTGAGSVVWYRNLSERGEPNLAAAETLLPGRRRIDGEGGADVPYGTRLKICVSDYNGDGLLDLLVGDLAHATNPDGAPPSTRSRITATSGSSCARARSGPRRENRSRTRNGVRLHHRPPPGAPLPSIGHRA